MNDTQLEQVVTDAVERHLKFRGLRSVVVRPETDSQGDDILRVFIVLDEDAEKLDPARMLGLVGHLRDRLAVIPEARFPLISYLSKKDFEKMTREAA